MTSELRLINALIGFCLPSGGTWPTPLALLGYVPCGIEREITVVLDGRDRTVPVDLICASALANHALCFEAKSATLHEGQLRRYQALTPIQLLRRGGLPPEIVPNRLTHDVAYVTERSHEAALGRQFAAISVTLTLVAGDEAGFALAHGAFLEPGVQQVFAAGVATVESAWPHHFVPFKSDSSDEEMVPAVAQALAGFIIQGRDFTVLALAERSVPHWLLCGDAERQRFRTRLTALIDRGMREHLGDYYERPGAPQMWRVTSGRLARPAQTERLRRRMDEFVGRIQGGAEPRPIQRALGFPDFDPLGVEEEEEEDEDLVGN
jgi:hypothetical protein